MDTQPYAEDIPDKRTTKEIVDSYPWYRKNKNGWPIETWKNRPILSFIRIVCQNIRKITG